jgi:FkbM family methyltransferase
VCRRYADYYCGNNGFDMRLDGELYFLERALEDISEPLAFDVGANRGEWTRALLALKPTARVHCFEPSEKTFEELNRVPSRGGNVVLNRLGLSSRVGILKLYHHRGNSLFSSVYPEYPGKPDDKVEEEAITVTTLDTYMASSELQHVNFVKIDAEGHDFEVLKGAAKALADGDIDIVQFEYGPYNISSRTFLRDIVAFTQGLNYSLFRLLPKGLLRVPKYEPEMDNFKPANYALIRDALIGQWKEQVCEYQQA